MKQTIFVVGAASSNVYELAVSVGTFSVRGTKPANNKYCGMGVDLVTGLVYFVGGSNSGAKADINQFNPAVSTVSVSTCGATVVASSNMAVACTESTLYASGGEHTDATCTLQFATTTTACVDKGSATLTGQGCYGVCL